MMKEGLHYEQGFLFETSTSETSDEFLDFVICPTKGIEIGIDGMPLIIVFDV